MLTYFSGRIFVPNIIVPNIFVCAPYNSNNLKTLLYWDSHEKKNTFSSTWKVISEEQRS